MYNFIKTIAEGRTPKELKQVPLPYARDGLGRSLSKQAVDYHYGKLYKAYVDRFNAGEGDPDFNEAGAFLHSIYFSQFRPPKNSNKPDGSVLNLIKSKHKSWEKFQEEFEKVAMGIQGSGWVYLAKDGQIKTITNHQIKNDIVFLIDWWEHAFQFDFGSDKKQYLSKQWVIINWDFVNTRL
jgi:superoxide dismutase, Fe-Mn family